MLSSLDVDFIDDKLTRRHLLGALTDGNEIILLAEMFAVDETYHSFYM